MSTRRLKIGIRTRPEREKALREAFRQVRQGDLTPREPGLYFESVEELRQILPEKRFDLLLTIARHHPGSVRELAEVTSRDYKNVSEDVALLERLGLVELEKRGGKGGAKAPVVPYDEIQVTIDLRSSGEAQAA